MGARVSGHDADVEQIGSSSRTIFNFAEAYTRIAREQHGSQPIPQRLPTEREVAEMIANVDLIKRSLEQVKDAVQASIQSERAREGTKMKGSYDEDHDVAMYGDGMKPQYGMQHEVKKRRGVGLPSPQRRQRAVDAAVDGALTPRGSERLRRDDATAATESTRPSGGAGPTAPGRSATRAACTMPSWSGSGSSRRAQYGPSPRTGAERRRGGWG